MKDDQRCLFRFISGYFIKAEFPLLASSWPAHGSDITLSGHRCLEPGSSSPINTYQFDSGSLPLALYFNQAVEV
ncbi:hypothetical protein OIU78_012063 [Salix suchowensis]|nr:hypothetical protein OIU78_012063 [Salix suchowensis]